MSRLDTQWGLIKGDRAPRVAAPQTSWQQAPEPKGDGGTEVTVQVSELDKAVPLSDGPRDTMQPFT